MTAVLIFFWRQIKLFPVNRVTDIFTIMNISIFDFNFQKAVHVFE